MQSEKLIQSKTKIRLENTSVYIKSTAFGILLAIGLLALLPPRAYAQLSARVDKGSPVVASETIGLDGPVGFATTGDTVYMLISDHKSRTQDDPQYGYAYKSQQPGQAGLV